VKKALVVIADGSEEYETVTVIDLLRRAEILVTVAAVLRHKIVAARGTTIVADKLLKDCTHDKWDIIILPGGMPGALNLSNSEKLITLLRNSIDTQTYIGAICAAPAVILNKHGLIKNRKVTCHKDYIHEISEKFQASEDVCISGNLITANGPASAVKFSIEIIYQLLGPVKSNEIKLMMGQY